MKKRTFDLVSALFGLIVLGGIIITSTVIAAFDTKSSGIFTQKRVGQYGRLFTIYKLRTIHKQTGKISKIGSFFRKSKLDELPQLLNVLIGNMSIVGPRPDIPGYYDRLIGESRKILELKPGLTCEASLKYADEELLLSKQENPLQYNDEIIFPDKIKMNLEYYYKQSLTEDFKIIIKTIQKII
ncbi:sugar transferase [Flavobacterium sp. U410]|jgi:lipopolysaccharide/colanic/teichoic acid biosynthesis glycosyltransferase